jgi:hypothetical protein
MTAPFSTAFAQGYSPQDIIEFLMRIPGMDRRIRSALQQGFTLDQIVSFLRTQTDGRGQAKAKGKARKEINPITNEPEERETYTGRQAKADRKRSLLEQALDPSRVVSTAGGAALGFAAGGPMGAVAGAYGGNEAYNELMKHYEQHTAEGGTMSLKDFLASAAKGGAAGAGAFGLARAAASLYGQIFGGGGGTTLETGPFGDGGQQPRGQGQQLLQGGQPLTLPPPGAIAPQPQPQAPQDPPPSSPMPMDSPISPVAPQTPQATEISPQLEKAGIKSYSDLLKSYGVLDIINRVKDQIENPIMGRRIVESLFGKQRVQDIEKTAKEPFEEIISKALQEAPSQETQAKPTALPKANQVLAEPIEEEVEEEKLNLVPQGKNILEGRVPISKIAAKPEIMQFKKIEDSETGENVADQLKGKFDPLKSGVLVLWKPKNPQEYGLKGDEEFIVSNGHHRLAFAKRQGVDSLLTRVIREEDGYTASDAMRIGAEINIAEGRGTVHDQAKYFRELIRTRGEAEASAEAERTGTPGQKAWKIAADAGDDLYRAFTAEELTADQAYAIASATDDPDRQALGLKFAKDGKGHEAIRNLLEASKTFKKEPSHQLDMFGFDDSAFRAMEDMAKAAQRIQKEIQQKITSIQGAARHPEKAKEFGVDVDNPEELLEVVEYLKAQKEEWKDWATHPEKVDTVKAVASKEMKPEDAVQLIKPEPEPEKIEESQQFDFFGAPTKKEELKKEPEQPIKKPRDRFIETILDSAPDFGTYAQAKPIENAKRINPFKSSNVRYMTYDKDNQEMQILFAPSDQDRKGSVYIYKDVPYQTVLDLVAGNAEASTTGQSIFRAWFTGKDPSIGAAFDQKIKKAIKEDGSPLYPFRRLPDEMVTDEKLKKVREADTVFKATQLIDSFKALTDKSKARQVAVSKREQYEMLKELDDDTVADIIMEAEKMLKEKGQRKTKKHYERALNEAAERIKYANQD